VNAFCCGVETAIILPPFVLVPALIPSSSSSNDSATSNPTAVLAPLAVKFGLEAMPVYVDNAPAEDVVPAPLLTEVGKNDGEPNDMGGEENGIIVPVSRLVTDRFG